MALPPQYSEGFGGGCSGQANAGHIQVHTREDSSNSLEEMFRVVTDPSCSFSSAKPLKDRKLPRSFFDPSPQSVLQPNMSPPVGEFHFRSASGVSSMQRSPLLTATHGAANASVAAESGPDAAGASPGLRLDTAPASVGVVGGGAAASVSHTRAHSSPAKISNQAAVAAAAAAAAAAVVQQHRQEHLGGPGQQAFYQQSRQTNQTDAAMQEAYADSPSTCPPEFEICPLPAGWEMAFNDENKIYFVDHNSKSTSWYDPRIPRQLQSGWGQSPSEVCRLHIDYLGRCNAYRKLSSLTAQKELLRWKLEMATRNEQLMRQEMYNHHSGGGGVTDPTLQCVFSVDHRRQESSDSGLAPETVATPPLLEIDSGACQMDTDASDTSVDGLLSSLKEADLLLAADIDLPSFRNDFQGSIN